MSLQLRIEAALAAIGADIKALQASSGGGSGTGTKVSELPYATALDGTELVPIVQGGNSEVVEVSTIRPWMEQILSTTYTNSTVTASNVFAGFTPLANTRYLVDALLTTSAAAATTGVQTGIIGPTTGVTRSAVKVISASAAGTDLISHQALNAFQAAVASLTTPTLLSIQAIIEMGSTPGAGNIRVQAKSEVAASAISIFPGSSMRWRVI